MTSNQKATKVKEKKYFPATQENKQHSLKQKLFLFFISTLMTISKASFS